MEKPRAKLSQLDTLAKGIAIPRDHKATRIPTFPALERTSTLAFTDTRVIAVGAAINDDTPENAYAMVCRDPGFPVWTTRFIAKSGLNTPVAAALYTRLYSSSGANLGIEAFVAQAVGPGQQNTIMASSTGLDLPVYPILRTTEGDFHPLFCQYLGVEVQVDQDVGASLTCSYDVKWLRDDGEISVTSFVTQCWPAAGYIYGNASLVPTGMIGYRMEVLYIETDVDCTLFKADFGQTSTAPDIAGVSRLCLTSPAGFVSKVLAPITYPVEYTSVRTPWDSVRCNAAAALFSNVTSVMNKEGTVMAGRLTTENSGLLRPSLWAQAITSIHPKDRYFGALENGLYTFTLPEQGSEEYREVTAVNRGVAFTGIPSAIFDLRHLNYFNAIIFSDLESGHGTNLAVTVDRHIEFRTSSLLFPLGFSAIALETYHVAQMGLVQAGVFYENPVHLATIAAVIGKALRTVAPYVMPVVKTAAIATGQKLLNIATQKLGNMAQASFSKPKQQRRQKKAPARKTKKARGRK